MTSIEQEQQEVAERLLAFVEAQGKLVAALEQVRASFDAGDDDWQHRLLNTLREYLRTIEIEPKLTDPLQVMLNDIDDRILKDRRKNEGKKGTPAHVGKSMSMSFAAMAITALVERNAYPSVKEAIWAVADAARLRRKELQDFRDNLNRWNFSDEVCKSAKQTLEAIRPWLTEDIMDAVRRLRTFVKDPI